VNALSRNLPLSRAEDGQETLVNATLLAGRVGLGLLFAISGFGKITGAGCSTSRSSAPARGAWTVDRR
jgi:uncharacterized membrane protein YphA (DoxX/SURF4 family)